MTTKNNLSAFKRPAAKSVLKTASGDPEKTKIGKPPKQPEERLSKRGQIMFTETEFAKITEQRGDVPLSAYLRSKLKEIGEI